jgi:hypothetical protein
MTAATLIRHVLAAAVAAAALAQPASAQRTADARNHAVRAIDAPAPAEVLAQQNGRLPALRIAKWTVAGATAGTALYGFLKNRRADDLYLELEELCSADAERCDDRLPGGAYADPELERRYQDVRAIDRRARTALVVGQVGVAASVVLFILDLRNRDDPENIPYEPQGLTLTPARDGGLSLGWSLGLKR